jgi:hypothetical protein
MQFSSNAGKLERSRSAAETVNEVQDDASKNANQNRSNDGEIDSRVLAAIDDVTRQTSYRQVKTASKHENQPEKDQNTSHKNHEFTKIVHALIVANSTMHGGGYRLAVHAARAE